MTYELQPNDFGMVSRFRTVENHPWSRDRHPHAGSAREGRCTVRPRKRHEAQRSVLLADNWGQSWWASCDEHVPPMLG